MAKGYHLSEDGTPKKCDADVRPCPLKNSDTGEGVRHFDTVKEGREYYENLMENGAGSSFNELSRGINDEETLLLRENWKKAVRKRNEVKKSFNAYNDKVNKLGQVMKHVAKASKLDGNSFERKAEVQKAKDIIYSSGTYFHPNDDPFNDKDDSLTNVMGKAKVMKERNEAKKDVFAEQSAALTADIDEMEATLVRHAGQVEDPQYGVPTGKTTLKTATKKYRDAVTRGGRLPEYDVTVLENAERRCQRCQQPISGEKYNEVHANGTKYCNSNEPSRKQGTSKNYIKPSAACTFCGTSDPGNLTWVPQNGFLKSDCSRCGGMD